MDLASHLPVAVSSHFTAIKGAGPVQHNLETALHRATLSSASPLRVLKPNIGGIAKVFNQSYVKKAIREGGLSAGEQKLVVKHILETNPGLGKSTHKTQLVKAVVKHFGKDQTKTGAAHPIIRRPMISTQPAHPTSINQIMHPTETTSAFNVTEQRQSTVVRNKIVGGISGLMSSRRGGGVTAPPPSRPPSLPPRLAV